MFSHRLIPPESLKSPFSLRWPNQNVQAKSLGEAAAQAIRQFQTSHTRHSNKENHDTLVMPMIQAGYMNVREEERFISSLFYYIRHLEDANDSLIDLTSGYFALHNPYQDYLISSPSRSRIIAAGPRVSSILLRRLINLI